MRTVWVLAKREFRVLVASRAFLFGTVVGVLAILSLSFLPGLLARWTAPTETTVVVSDRTGQAAGALQGVQAAMPELVRPHIAWKRAAETEAFAGEAAPSLEQLKQAAADGKIGDFLYVDRDQAGELRWVVGGKEVSGAVVRGVQQLATPVAVADRARRWGIAPEQVAGLQAPAQVEVEEIKPPEAAHRSPVAAGSASDLGETISFWMAYLLMFALYMTLILYGQAVSNGVAAEKGNRVVEMVLVGARPSQILRGKLLGVSLTSLVQYLAWGAAAAVALVIQRTALQQQLSRLVGFPVELSAVPPWLLGYLILFFLLGFMSYSALFAASASLASRPEEANQTVWPPVLLILAAYMVAAVGMADPTGRVAVVGSMVPFVGPMAMFTRLVMTAVPVSHILISVATSLVAAWLTLLLAERVYRGSILLTRRTGWLAALRQGS